MEYPEFPPNSEASKRQQQPEEDKSLTRVTSKEPVRRRKSLWKQFKGVFIAGDFKSTTRYVVMDVFLPMTRDIIYEVGAEGLRNLVFGESRRYRGVTRPQAGDYGYVAYNRYSSTGPPSRMRGPERAISRQARAQHNFDEIVLDSRVEAEQVIDELFEVVSRYESASVADLYQLVGLPQSHTDHKWGWTDLSGAGVSRIRDGYLLDLPDPEPLRA
jgi:hypothetical protein